MRRTLAADTCVVTPLSPLASRASLTARIVCLALVALIVAFGDVSFAEVVAGPNASIVASDPFSQKQLEVDAAASPVNPNHIFAGYINYQTVLENPNRVTSKGRCGYSFSTNGGKTWRNYLLPALPNADKCGDPAVAWDTNGHAFYFALTELTDGATTIMTVWRFTDPDDGSGSLVLDRHVQIDAGTSSSGQVLDKGALVFQTDTTQGNPNAPGILYACYSNFDGKNNKKIVCAISRDGGLTYSRPNQGKYNGNINSNNGTAAAPGPDGSICLFWRAFSGTENGYHFVKVSPNGDATTPRRIPVGSSGFYPYDAPTLPDLARSNAFPTVASDGNQGILLAFQAYVSPGRVMAPASNSGVSPRILGVYSADGGANWSDPFVVDYGPHDNTHQFMPRATYAGGLWSITFFDARNHGCFDQDGTSGSQECGTGRPLDPNPVVIDGVPHYFPRGRDRRFDLRVAQSLDPLHFGSSTQVSRYETRTDTHEIVQRDPACAPNCPALNYPFLSVGSGGNSAWMGDYIAHAAKFQFLRNTLDSSLPAWRYTRPGDPVTTLAFWPDFRRVAFPLNANGVPDIDAIININNTPVSGWTQFVPAAPPPGNACTNPKSRDVDVLFSEITNGGLSASVRSTVQRSGIPPDFTVNVQNLSGRNLFVRLEVVDTAPVEDWSVAQTTPAPAEIPADDNIVDVRILKNSSVAKTFYYRWRSSINSVPAAPVPVRVYEIDGIGGQPVSDGLSTSATYNASSFTIPLIGAAHGVTVSSPVVTYGQHTQQSFSRTGQPSNQLIENQLIENQLIENQLIENQLIENQLIENQLIENSLIPDQQVLWTVTGAGALTTASTAFSNVTNGQELLSAGWDFQLLLYQTQLNPKVCECTQLEVPTDVVLSNIAITEPNQLIENFQISNQLIENQLIENQLIENSPLSDQVSNVTFAVDSGEQVHVALRAFKPASSTFALRTTTSAASSTTPTFNPSDPDQIGEAVFGQASDPLTGGSVGAFFDTTRPEITPIVNGTLGDNGWYVSSVTVNWLVKDPQSGIASKNGCDPVTLSSDTAGVTLECSAVNRVNMTQSASVTIMIDRTPPEVTAAITPSIPAPTGWYNIATGAPTVTFTCTDTVSGVLACPPPVLVGNGANQTVSSDIVTDVAGNTAVPATISGISVDTIAPAAAAAISPPNPATTGWYNIATGRPVVSFTCSDTGGSGLAGPCPASVAVGDGVAQTISRIISDIAGNTTTAAQSGINVDTIAPGIMIVAPADNATYLLNASVSSSYYCSDNPGSGLATCAGPVPTGSNFYTSLVGLNTFAVTAGDAAGNTASKTNTYINVYNFVLSPPKSPAKLGSSVPLIWKLTDANGTSISDLNSLVTLTTHFTAGVQPVICPITYPGTSQVKIHSPAKGDAGKSNFRYTSSFQFQYNWDSTTALPTGPGCYTIVFQLNDNAGPGPNYSVLSENLLKKTVVQLK